LEPNEYEQITFSLTMAMLVLRICYLGVGYTILVNSVKDSKVIPTFFYITILSGLAGSINILLNNPFIGLIIIE
jgi:hypothetical protein